MAIRGSSVKNFISRAFAIYALSSASLLAAQNRAEANRRVTHERMQGENADFSRSVSMLKENQFGQAKASPAFVGEEQPNQKLASNENETSTAPQGDSEVRDDDALGFQNPSNSSADPKKSASENPFQAKESDLFPEGSGKQNTASSKEEAGEQSPSGDERLAAYDEQLAQLAKQREKKAEETNEDTSSVAVAVAKNRLKLLKELAVKRVKKWIADLLAAATDGAVIGLFLHAYSRYLGWRMRNIPSEIQKNTIKTKEGVRKLKDQSKTTVADITKEERRVRRERRQYLEQLREGE